MVLRTEDGSPGRLCNRSKSCTDQHRRHAEEIHTLSTTTPTHPADATLSTTELARRWKCSPGHLANLRAADASPVPYMKLFAGGRIVYRLSDVLTAEAAALVSPTRVAA